MNRNFVKLLLTALMLVFCLSAATPAEWIRNEDGTLSYQTQDGSLYTSGRKKIGKYYYYFDREGKIVKETWVGRRYYKKNGRMAVNTFVGERYVGKSGKYVRGLKKIKGQLYYFDPATGNMVTDQSMTIGNKTYHFGEDGTSGGNGSSSESGSSIKSSPSVSVESTYFSDPDVSDEELLAAIIYSEAGNQPFAGQLAVGLVITNRVRSSLFPNTIREVIYAKDQFTPASCGYLTSVLKGRISVSSEAKQAAAQVLSMLQSNTYKITGADGKKINMKGYLFFMTPAAYRSMGLGGSYMTLGDHVFFKSWA